MRAYQYRFYPTAAQRLLLDRYFGTARWAWNHALERRSKAYRRRKESITGIDVSRAITQLKKTTRYAWIKHTPATVIVQRLRDQDAAFQNFFAGRARYPRFKKRGSGDRIRFQLDQRQVDRMYRPGELLKLPGLGPLKLKWSRSPNGKPKMVTVRRDAAGAGSAPRTRSSRNTPHRPSEYNGFAQHRRAFHSLGVHSHRLQVPAQRVDGAQFLPQRVQLAGDGLSLIHISEPTRPY